MGKSIATFFGGLFVIIVIALLLPAGMFALSYLLGMVFELLVGNLAAGGLNTLLGTERFTDNVAGVYAVVSFLTASVAIVVKGGRKNDGLDG
ncbi:hypothetical protein JCM19037_1606 [Geomicrobium sp. JCM 19037]|uniref:hypothetical protein n=1 Tax=Geomicrobium sp. JCM 19037 TaxID=1460634 RepID=UPI00045F3BC6|nr:hypothetical protein [Geomicrobium sp. JCM 19037]GAK03293.1 hypothetical protein JCM19037_1606 [Geomicrobium sp. JCM 19037]